MDECRRLAREGEKATRMGDALKGIELLEKAIEVGIDDYNEMPLLSAIYSQLGNAYYAQKMYEKALDYHSHDLLLSRMQKDIVQQAKAYSNMSATFTMLNNFDQAISCAGNVICLGRKLGDKGLECRGLYNLGLAHLQNAIQGNLERSEEMNSHLEEAVQCFESHLEIARERKDEILCGLAIGNLGNAHFYLGNYAKSIAYHIKRLDIARAVGDKSSMRRSFTNMANAYVLLGNHEEAAKCYRLAYSLARETGRKNLEAQLLFSLGTVETLRKDYEKAVRYYTNHLRLARQLSDNAGESRAYSSLASAFGHLDELPKALYFLVTNYKLAEKLGDASMKQSTLDDIRQLIKRNPSSVIADDRICLDASFDPENLLVDDLTFDSIGEPTLAMAQNRLEVPSADTTSAFNNSSSALSMPNLSLSFSLESFIRECARGSSSTPKRAGRIPLSSTDSVHPTPKAGELSFADVGLTRVPLCKSEPDIKREQEDEEDDNDFFERIMRMQGNQLDEQRANPDILKDRTNSNLPRHTDNLSARSISGDTRRMTLSSNLKSLSHNFRKNVVKPFNHAHQKRHKSTSGLRPNSDWSATTAEDGVSVSGSEDEFCRRANDNPETILDLIESIQGRRMNEQRADLVLPGLNNPKQLLEKINFGVRRRSEGDGANVAITDEEGKIDERLYELIMQSQADRLEDQRSELGGRSARTDSGASSSLITEELVSELVQKMQVGRLDDQRATLGSGSRASSRGASVRQNNSNGGSRAGVRSACGSAANDVVADLDGQLSDGGVAEASGANSARDDGANSNSSGGAGPASPVVSA